MKKVYSLKPFYKITNSLFVVVAIGYVFLNFKRLLIGSSEWLSSIIVMGWAILGIAYLYDALFKKLIISSSGIEYHAFLRHFFLPWNQIEEIPARLSFKVLIGRPSTGKIKQTIALYQFTNNPIDSELGQQIKQYTPHLFEKENPHKSVKSVAEL